MHCAPAPPVRATRSPHPVVIGGRSTRPCDSGMHPGPVLRERGKRQGALFPHRITVTIEQDRAEPGEKLAAPVVTAQTLPCFHQRVLRQVFGQRGVAAERDGLPQQPGSMDAANLTKRFCVARPGLFEQTSRLWDFGFHERWTQAEHISIIAENADSSIAELSGPSIFFLADHGFTASPICGPSVRKGGPSFSTKMSAQGYLSPV